jgi:hypothetical protein
LIEAHHCASTIKNQKLTQECVHSWNYFSVHQEAPDHNTNTQCNKLLSSQSIYIISQQEQTLFPALCWLGIIKPAKHFNTRKEHQTSVKLALQRTKEKEEGSTHTHTIYIYIYLEHRKD